MSANGQITFSSRLSYNETPSLEIEIEWNGINPVIVSMELLKDFDIKNWVSLGDGSYLLYAKEACYRLEAIFPIDFEGDRIAFNVSVFDIEKGM